MNRSRCSYTIQDGVEVLFEHARFPVVIMCGDHLAHEFDQLVVRSLPQTLIQVLFVGRTNIEEEDFHALQLVLTSKHTPFNDILES